tara:strand:+ start:265 stop:477 length:213 start_codon:yes stop_codon:yes gene_type:complete
MRETTLTYNDEVYTVKYEYDEGERATYDHPGANPTVRIWTVYDKLENDITHKIKSQDWYELETLCFENET